MPVVREPGTTFKEGGKTFFVKQDGTAIEMVNPDKPLEADVVRQRSRSEARAVRRIENLRQPGDKVKRPSNRSGVSTSEVKQERRVQRSKAEEEAMKRKLSSPKKRLRPRI